MEWYYLISTHPGINSREFRNFLKKENIPIIFTAVNAPFSNGLKERLNQTLVNKIRCTINEKKYKAWTTIAHECTQRYNETEHTVTGFTPTYLMEGEVINILPEELREHKTQKDLLEDRRIALERTINSHKYNKQQFDKNRKNYKLKGGDYVYLENGNRLNRKKLEELKIGPFKILDKLSNTIYKINTGHKKQESNLFHITKLIPVSEDMQWLYGGRFKVVLLLFIQFK